MSKRIFKTELAGREIIVETGHIAQLANAAVLIRYGDTTVLSTVTASKSPREGIDFFPLSVDYEEKMYSVGKIPGGFIKREGRPSEHAVLSSRMIDRPIRPLFPKDLRNDVVVNNLVLAVNHDNSPEICSMIGTSIAITISDVPWNGPIAGVKVGIVDGEIIINPNLEAQKQSTLDLTVAGTIDKVCMIEAGADEVADDVMLEAIIAGHKEIQNICKFINEIQAEIGKEKFQYVSSEIPAEIFEEVKRFAYDDMRQAVLNDDKTIRDLNIDRLTEKVTAHLEAINPDWLAFVGEAIYTLEKKVVREYLFKEHKRVDGRGLNDIRPLASEIDLIPRVHGSALFQRGQTQVMTLCTLGTMRKSQNLDGVDWIDNKRYMHHYNFPPYSVGEARAARSPGRREIGHGALAERSLIPVLPSPEEFPYAIRNVSEITMSNGSTSQGAVCASTLALMAAGVPIKRPVAGISTGLIVNKDDENDYLVFMDIQGIEDFFGDMDFKVAGTTEGITSIQVDIKVDGLSYDIIRDAFALTKQGRLQIINEVILPCISEPKKELSEYAPKIDQIDIPSDKIREVIGQGGKVIKRITEETETEIEIEEDGDIGHVYIASPNQEAANKAIEKIKAIAYDPEAGTVLKGVVTRLMKFGAFVEIAPGKEGLVHISKISWNRVERIEDALEVGQAVNVIVLETDEQGRLNLSMRDLVDKPADYRSEGFEGNNRPNPVERGQRKRPDFSGPDKRRNNSNHQPRFKNQDDTRQKSFSDDKPRSRNQKDF